MFLCSTGYWLIGAVVSSNAIVFRVLKCISDSLVAEYLENADSVTSNMLEVRIADFEKPSLKVCNMFPGGRYAIGCLSVIATGLMSAPSCTYRW